jgi:acetylglutamate kinase
MRIVIKVGGNVVDDPASVRTLAQEIHALLAHRHEVLVVHGGGPQLDEALAGLGEPLEKVDGLRVTSRRAADVVLRVLDALGADLVRALAQQGVPARHEKAREGRFRARVKDPRLGRVGTAGAVLLPTAGGVPVLTPVGFDDEGPLNLNADEGAAAVAIAWKADWLVLATDVAAVRDAAGVDVASLTPEGARELLKGAAKGGMIPKLQNALQALEGGVQRVLVTKVGPGILQDAVLKGIPHGTLVARKVFA